MSANIVSPNARQPLLEFKNTSVQNSKRKFPFMARHEGTSDHYKLALTAPHRTHAMCKQILHKLSHVCYNCCRKKLHKPQYC